MRVLHLLWDGHSGGTQRYVNRVIQSPDWDDCEHAVCLFADPGVEIDPAKVPYEVRTLDLPSGFAWRRAARLRQIVAELDPSILHLHCDTPAFLHQAGRFPERRLVYTEHGDSVVRSRRQLPTRLCWTFAARHVDAVVLNSEYAQSVFLGQMPRFSERCTVLPNPLLENPPPRPERSAGPFRIGVIGRLHSVKGFDRLFDAAAVLPSDSQLELHVFGEGAERADLEQRASALESCETRFHGFTSTPLEAIASLDLLVIPSRKEAFGLTALEAQAMGTPVIANAVGGLPERVEHEQDGLLCDASDPDELAESIARLMSDESLCQSLAERGRETASRHGLDQHVGRLKALYHAL